MMTSAALLLWAALPARVLGLAEAVQTARQRQPQLQEQRANTEAATARSQEARSGLLPEVTATVGYERASLSFGRQGSLPGAVGTSTTARLAGENFWSSTLRLSVPVYDFGRSLGRWRSAQAQAASQRSREHGTLQQVVLEVRLAFFQARAQRALVRVAQETLANQRLHQKQIEGFVQVGTRPAIDLAQIRTEVANAEVSRIQAENQYLVSRAQLNRAMGVTGTLDFEVTDETLRPVPGEDGESEALVRRALRERPELAALAQQQESQRQQVRAARGGYFPLLTVDAGLSESASALQDLQLNWSAGVTVVWPLFQGLQTRSQVRETRATLRAFQAQAEGQAQQVRLEVLSALLEVRGAKAATGAAEEARRNARERLRLAEGRYAAGVGNVIELGDAQTAMTQAEAQVIQAEFNLASARARLLASLGDR